MLEQKHQAGQRLITDAQERQTKTHSQPLQWGPITRLTVGYTIGLILVAVSSVQGTTEKVILIALTLIYYTSLWSAINR